MPRKKPIKISGLERKGKRKSGYFDDLPPNQQRRAENNLSKMIRRRRSRGEKVDGWVLPILVGQARRNAINPPTSAWGKSMHAKRGGYAVQQQYRMEGRNPTEKATYIRQYKKGKPSKPALNEIAPTEVASLEISPIVIEDGSRILGYIRNPTPDYDSELEPIREFYRQQKRELHQEYSRRSDNDPFFADEY